MVNHDLMSLTSDVANGFLKLVAAYESRITELEQENKDLRKIALIQSQHVAELCKTKREQSE